MKTMEIEQNWGIEATEVQALSERAILLMDGNQKRYILKKHFSEDKINLEINLLQKLHQEKATVQQPLAESSGNFYVAHESEFYSLYTYIEGKSFSAMECLENSNAPILLGQSIAKLTNNLKSIPFEKAEEKDLNQIVWDYAVREVAKIDDDSAFHEKLQLWEQDCKEVIDSLSKQWIHRDAHIHNIIFKEESLAGFIDLQIAEVNVNIFDICYCATSVLNEVFVPHKDNWISFAKALFTSFKSEVNYEVKNDSFWYVMLSIQLIFMAYFKENKEIYTANKAMFEWILSEKEELTNI